MIRETPSFRKYRVVAELDSGGMANVFLCVTKGVAGVNKLHVLKQMRPELLDDDNALQMFLDEARLVVRLNHPNVVQTHEVGEEDGRYYLAMEYLDGQSLAALLRKGAKKIPLHLHLRVLCDALAGLHYAHELRDFDGTPLGVVHRDVSPQNVFITYAGQVKLLDFGIAKASVSHGKTQAGTLKGKIPFMSPEQVLGEEVDRRADVFSMGIMLWNAIAGRPIWAGQSEVNIVQRLCKGDLPTLASAGATADPELEAIMLRALSIDRTKRHATASELRMDLETYLLKKSAHESAEDAGDLVQRMFASDRERVSKAIEEHMARLAAEPDREHTPIAISLVPAPPTSDTGAGTGPGTKTGPGTGTDNGVAISLTGDRLGERRRTRLYAVAAGGALLALVLVLAGRRLFQATPSASVSAAAPAPAEVEVEIRAAPREAVLLLDGQRLDGNPHTGRRAQSTEPHQLQAVLPDGSSETRTVVFDKDLRLEIAVTPARIPAGPAPSVPPTTAAAIAAVAAAPKAGAVSPPSRAGAPAAPPAPTAPAVTPPPTPAAPAPPPTPEATGRHAKPKPSLDKIDL